MSKRPFSIIVAGTPVFAVPSLRALIDDPAFDMKLVITQPDKPVGRKKIIAPSPVKTLAMEAGIPVWQPENINREWQSKVECHASKDDQHATDFRLSTFDYLVVVAYGQILSEEILGAPRIAPVNLHASLLPRWRGASPIQSAILAGDTETGVTVQKMVRKLDAGPVLAREATPIAADETFRTLHDRLSAMGANLLVHTLKHTLVETPQAESSSTICSQLSRSGGIVDTQMTAEEIDRHVRALVPWPGVRMTIDGEEVKLIATSLQKKKDSIEVDCKDSVLSVVTLQPSGKNAMPAAAWMRGRR